MTDEAFLGQDPAPAQVPAQQEPVPGVAPSNSDYAELLAAITNSEGKQKYKSIADALLGHVRAEEHIRKVEGENAELRKVQTKVETLEQVLQRLESGKPVDPQAPRVEDQESLIASVLEKRERAQLESTNRKQTLDAIRAKFGDKVNDVLESKANELGLTVAELGNLAAKSPKLVLGHFNLDTRGTPTVQSTVNTQALQPKSGPAEAPSNMLYGASTKEAIAFMRQIGEEVKRDLGLI